MIRIIGMVLTLGFLAACAEVEPYETYTLYAPVSQPRAQPHSKAETNFVIAMFDKLQRLSISENREYCGYIGLNTAGRFVATPAKRGKPASCIMPALPQNIRILATYHTHAAYDGRYDNEVPSYSDLAGDIDLGRDGYVSTPGGRVWLNIALEKRAVMVCDRNCVYSDPGFIPDPELPVVPQFSIAALQARQN
ncbi:MAG: DUF4329 domain-containing protein [Rhodobacteraceae bacterium]|nr:DUF4329 domain-containing protein [Paracoccaceae bacterium]